MVKGSFRPARLIHEWPSGQRFVRVQPKASWLLVKLLRGSGVLPKVRSFARWFPFPPVFPAEQQLGQCSYMQVMVIVSSQRTPGVLTILRITFQKAITIRHLRVIAALSEVKLVARVSEALNVSQPAVSKQIAELERIVGAPIVTRERNRLFLTPIGQRLAEYARQALNQLDRAAFDIEAMASGVSGSVSVGVVSSVAPTLLPGAIALFKGSTQQASISIKEGHFVELLPELETGELDVLIARIWQPQELPGIAQLGLFAEPVVVVAGRNHKLAKRADLDWGNVVDFPWILPQANSVARRAIDALFAGYGLTPPANTIASLSLTLNLALLEAIPALCLMPQRLAQAHAARGDIVTLPLDTRGLLSEVRCFWRSEQVDTNPTLTFFLKCLEKVTEDLKTIPLD